MELLNSLLKAVIAFQDVIDDSEIDYRKWANLRMNMLEEVDKAESIYPEIINRYHWNFTKNKQLEFDNLQKFISDFNRINHLRSIPMNEWNEEELKFYKSIMFSGEESV